MLQTVEGRYHDGKIELFENPIGIDEARVIVTFLPIEDDEEKERLRLEALDRLIADMREGLNFGPGKFNRNEIYEERMEELDRRREQNRAK